MTANVWPLFSTGADAAPGSFPPAGLTVGRVGLTAPVTGVTSWAQSGDSVSIAGQFVVTNAVHAETLRQQISAYAAGVDEDVVPVTWAEDPSVDGYYRVASASFSSRPSSLHSHLWDYRLDLERVRHGWRLAGFESIVSAAWSTNAAARGSQHAKPWVAVPGSVVDLSRNVTTQLHCADTTAGVALVEIAEVVPPLSTRWAVPPADFYAGSARLFAGDRLVVGTQVDIDPFGWVIGNGVMEVRLLGEGVGKGNIMTRHRLAAGWSAWKPWFFDLHLRWSVPLPPVLSLASAMRVIRNDPSEVIVRVLAVTDIDDVDTTGHRHSYDIALRRGSPYCTITAKADRLSAWSLTRTGGETPATTTEYGDEGVIVADEADADGLSYVVASPYSWTVDSFGGAYWNKNFGHRTLTCAIGAIGANVADSSVTEDAVRMADRVLTAQGERVQAIAW